jgi:hypothetical protein
MIWIVVVMPPYTQNDPVFSGTVTFNDLLTILGWTRTADRHFAVGAKEQAVASSVDRGSAVSRVGARNSARESGDSATYVFRSDAGDLC